MINGNDDDDLSFCIGLKGRIRLYKATGVNRGPDLNVPDSIGGFKVPKIDLDVDRFHVISNCQPNIVNILLKSVNVQA